MRILRLIVYILSVALTAGAAFAATDPPAPDEVAMALTRLADLLERGGPAVIALEVTVAIAVLATLGAITLVLTTTVQAAHKLARPVGDAWATILRGGPTQREEAARARREAELEEEAESLRAENRTLHDEVETLNSKVAVLEHAEEEHRTIVGMLLDRLEAANINMSGVRELYQRRSDAVAA